MEIFDAGCFVGNWPFRKIRNNTFKKIKGLHDDNQIISGCASSLDAVFYNDPTEADNELSVILKDSGYKHILSVNPTLPAYENDIIKASESISGIRIYPGYHNYTLKDECVLNLCKIAASYHLPVFITMRMEDERNTYIFQPRKLDMDEISYLLNTVSDCTIILSSVRYNECVELQNAISSNKNVYMDTAGLKDGLFTVERVLELIPADKILFASFAPINCIASTKLLIEKDNITKENKEKIFYKNALKLLNK